MVAVKQQVSGAGGLALRGVAVGSIVAVAEARIIAGLLLNPGGPPGPGVVAHLGAHFFVGVGHSSPRHLDCTQWLTTIKGLVPRFFGFSLMIPSCSGRYNCCLWLTSIV